MYHEGPFIQITKWQLQYFSDYVMQCKICDTKSNGNNKKLNLRISSTFKVKQKSRPTESTFQKPMQNL